MDKAIAYHFKKNIKERVRLTGGWKETWLLILSDNQKVVFRTNPDFITSGGRKIVMADNFELEKFFYDGVNKELGHICPEVYIVDGTREYYDDAYQISEYIEGEKLSKCFREDFDERTKNNIYYKIGKLAAKINKIEIDINHPYVKKRGSWEEYISNRLYERLSPLVKFDLITPDGVK